VQKKPIVSAALGAAGFLMLAGMADAAEIKVLASNAIKEAYLELVPQFEKSSEHKVVTTWAGTVDIMKRMAAGETFDLVIMAGASLDELVKRGNIVPGSRVDLVKSGVGVAVRTSAPKPDISSGDALKKTLLAAKSVGLSTGPSGVYVAGLFQRMGIADEIKPKLKQVPPGVPVGTIIASGEAEIGFQQVSELIHVSGIDYIGPLPADVQHITVFSGGIHTGAKQPDAAKALVKFITAPAAVPVIKKHGLEPG
jgi:molybdate transport system substrate-binding protein